MEASNGAHSDEDDRFTVLIAGGGVAGVEAILALREAGPPEINVELLTTSERFVLGPLTVAEPFGADAAPEIDLNTFCEEHDVKLRLDPLAEVWPEPQRALTESGVELPYDALLLCPGARRRRVLGSEDALTYTGGAETEAMENLIAEATDAGAGRIAFVVPDDVVWPLPLYELALLIADRLGDSAVDVSFVTHESAPLGIFGAAAAGKVAEILDEAGVELIVNAGSGHVPGHAIAADWTVTLPALEVPELTGVSQSTHGFIPVDARMRVDGTPHVWAVGDVTWFPIKQGGIAAQQADVAAADIAAEAGAEVEVPPFVPVLRAALLTADGPYYLRSGDGAEDAELEAPLWWPPAKVAGRLLAPYLAKGVDAPEASLVDLNPDRDQAEDGDYAESVALALRWADLDAGEGEYRRALHWLEIAEGLNLTLPEEAVAKRADWQEQLGVAGDPAA